MSQVYVQYVYCVHSIHIQQVLGSIDSNCESRNLLGLEDGSDRIYNLARRVINMWYCALLSADVVTPP